jgi:hypothetical protein
VSQATELREAARRLLRIADELEQAERTRAYLLAQSGSEFADYAIVRHLPSDEPADSFARVTVVEADDGGSDG